MIRIAVGAILRMYVGELSDKSKLVTSLRNVANILSFRAWSSASHFECSQLEL